jgi:hypothetical protein
MLPKTIWCLWFQGWDKPPELVQACAASWRQHNPGWTIHYLTRDTLAPYLPQSAELDAIFAKGMPPEALSNVVRIELLRQFGGVWVDATCYCLRPLDDWIHAATPKGFFAFEHPDRDRMLGSWFLAAEPSSHVVDAWQRRTLAYWHGRSERHTYFWFHYLFRELYNDDSVVRAIWDATPKILADGRHSYIPYEEELFRPVSDHDRSVVETKRFPLFKLTHKIDHAAPAADSVYRWLCNRVMRASPSGAAILASEAMGRPPGPAVASAAAAQGSLSR